MVVYARCAGCCIFLNLSCYLFLIIWRIRNTRVIGISLKYMCPINCCIRWSTDKAIANIRCCSFLSHMVHTYMYICIYIYLLYHTQLNLCDVCNVFVLTAVHLCKTATIVIPVTVVLNCLPWPMTTASSPFLITPRSSFPVTTVPRPAAHIQHKR